MHFKKRSELSCDSCKFPKNNEINIVAIRKAFEIQLNSEALQLKCRCMSGNDMFIDDAMKGFMNAANIAVTKIGQSLKFLFSDIN